MADNFPTFSNDSCIKEGSNDGPDSVSGESLLDALDVLLICEPCKRCKCVFGNSLFASESSSSF